MIAPANSQLVLNTTNSVTIASFVCDSGYYLKGSSEITCMSDGTWDSELPTCSMYEILFIDTEQISKCIIVVKQLFLSLNEMYINNRILYMGLDV